jgi:2-keto-4-pentenoate hydratase/2-oxohepta-3-ene-1,7-dioic acid hydratase in catechol pathway
MPTRPGPTCHPGAPIVLPAACEHGPEVDFEAELGVIIGRAARDVSETDALDHVLGYCCANDVSARRWQKHGGGGQWVRGKSFDSAASSTAP